MTRHALSLAAAPAVSSAANTAGLNPQPLPPSPNRARALPPGPDARVKITEAYAAHVARDAFFWAWPMVNIYNRRLGFAGVDVTVTYFRPSPSHLTLSE